MAIGTTRIVCPGRAGTHLGQLTFTFDKHKVRIADSHRLIPLDHSLPEDPEMRALLAPVLLDLNALIGADGDEYQSQVVAFLKDPIPQGGGQLHLLDLKTGQAYPIPHPGLQAREPVLGYGKNKVAFVGYDSAGTGEVMLAQPGQPGVDTLTREGGRASGIRFIYKGNALLYLYTQEGQATLRRADPWNRETRALTDPEMGRVSGYDINPSENQIALVARKGDSSTLYLADLDLASPVVVHSARRFLGSPVFGPDGNTLAFLVEDDVDDGQGRVHWLDMRVKGVQTPEVPLRASEITWSHDGQSLLLSQGAALQDLNEFKLKSGQIERVTASRIVRSERHARPKLWGKRDGLLLESVNEQGVPQALFLDNQSKDEIPLSGELPSSLR
jgi:hypothetical protein